MKKHCTPIHLVASILLLAAAAARGATVTNTIAGSAFNPQNMTINVGDTVVWKNTDFLTHSVVGTGSDPMCGGVFLGNGATCSTTFNSAGSFPYVCGLHAFMTASITVNSTVNVPPSVNLTNPPSGKKFRAPASFPLIATASDSD